MTEEQVERVAKLLCETAHPNAGWSKWVNSASSRTKFRAMARAAIAAIQPVAAGRVEICPLCDIAGCRHIRERKAIPTQPTPQEATPRWDSDWQWWAGRNEEWLTVGPCATREEAIAEMVDDGSGEYLDDSQDPPVWMNSFYVVEARQDPLRLADWIGADWILEQAEDRLADSDRVGSENDDGPWFEATKEQEADLVARLRTACDDWQAAHGLVFDSMTFSNTHTYDYINTPALRAIAGEDKADA